LAAPRREPSVHQRCAHEHRGTRAGGGTPITPSDTHPLPGKSQSHGLRMTSSAMHQLERLGRVSLPVGEGQVVGCREQASWHCNKTSGIFRGGTKSVEKEGIKVKRKKHGKTEA